MEAISYQGYVLDDLIGYFFREKLGTKLELKRIVLLDILRHDFFVEFEPGWETLAVYVLQTEEPNFSQSYGLDNLVEKLLAGGAWLDGKLKLGVHGGHPHVDWLGHDYCLLVGFK